MRCLGKGGFGEVWEAVDEEAVRVALKFVRLDDDAVGGAEWDALQIIKNIRHPNLLVPFKSWQSPDHLVIGMELADGTLRQRFDAARRDGHPGVPRGELIEYLREAAKGLDFLNESRHELENGRRGAIYHCDVKPQNILLMGGAVKVADFGLSRFTDHSITGRDAAMTVQFAAPEFLNRKASRYSDQYSLAVTYCFLRGGRLPFSGDNVQALMVGHLKHDPDLAMLPASEKAPVARALKKNPRSRYPNCRTFVDALAEIEDRVPTSGSRPSGWRSSLAVRLARLWPGRRDPVGDTTANWPPTRSRHADAPEVRSTETETPRDDKPPKPADADLRDF